MGLSILGHLYTISVITRDRIFAIHHGNYEMKCKYIFYTFRILF